MAIPFVFLVIISLTIPSFIASNQTLSMKESRRKLGYSSSSCINPIDICSGWCNNNWLSNRQLLAECGVGYGKNATGGKGGNFYVVTSSEDRAVNPRPGTLRHAVIQKEPLWIVFESDMVIALDQELIMSSYKTIDGRGKKVEFVGCSGFTLQNVQNIIIESVTITGMKSCGDAVVTVGPGPYESGLRGKSDGDAISITQDSLDVWIDHCTLSSCNDGLIDITLASTAITVTNCRFSDHDDVMLLGHNDAYDRDVVMRVTIAFNIFGQGLVERMPRVRFGRAEVINNYYPYGWEDYAIGGSACSTIISMGNIYVASTNPFHKQVTSHIKDPESEWEGCTNWNSVNDVMLQGAFFTTSGSRNSMPESMGVRDTGDVIALTANAGALY